MNHHAELKPETRRRVRNYRFEILFFACGLLLAAFCFMTSDIRGGEAQAQETNRSYYNEAVSLQDAADALGFSGFQLEDYPVAFWDGTYDYVFYEDTVSKRNGVLSTYAAAVYPVDGHFEVIVPEYESVSGLLDLAGLASGPASASESSESLYLATIWHEAFHAYQFTNYSILGEQITAEDYLDGAEEAESDSADDIILAEIDGNPEIKEMLSQEIEMLYNIISSEDTSGLTAAVLVYESMRSERFALMSDEAIEAEIYSELVEGTACYVESQVYLYLQGETAYESSYLDTDNTYTGGNTKFYHTGMIKCLILDRLDPDWKQDLDFSKDLDTLIQERLG